MISKFGVLFVMVAHISITLAIAPCICTREEKPVCGSDGRTYSNMCMLKCAQSSDPSLSLQRVGDCGDREQPTEDTQQGNVVDLTSCSCPRAAKYVCGNDGNTYDNSCLLDCAARMVPGLHVQNVGPCDNSVKVVEHADNVSCICSRNYKPVCASNGVTFENECYMRCAGTHLTVQSSGSCENN